MSSPHLSSILDKNEAIAKHAEGIESSSALDCQPGRDIYFGSSIGLRSLAHDGFLCFKQDDSIEASAPSMTPLARFVILNADNFQDNSTVRFGDAILLQIGEYEVLGAKYKVSTDGVLTPYLSIINSRGDNIKKAIAFGTWIILDQRDVIGNMGSMVGHMDTILLEKQWGFLSSSSPQRTTVLECGSFEDVRVDIRQDISWVIHFLPLNGIHDLIDYKSLNRGLLSTATSQLDNSAEGRQQANQVLSRLSRKFNQLKSRNNSNTLDTARTMPYKLKKLKRTQMKIAILERPISPSLSTQLLRNRNTLSRIQDVQSYASPLLKADALYQEYSNLLRISCKEWSSMRMSMSKYYDVNPSIRTEAARTIQRWFQRYVLKFSFQRAFTERRKFLDLISQNSIRISSARSALHTENFSPSTATSVPSIDHPRNSSRAAKKSTTSKFPSNSGDLRYSESPHFSRRALINILAKPVGYGDKRLSVNNEEKGNLRSGLRLLKASYENTHLFDDLRLVKLRRKHSHS